MAARCFTSRVTESTGGCASKPWLSSGGVMSSLPSMHWPEMMRKLLKDTGQPSQPSGLAGVEPAVKY